MHVAGYFIEPVFFYAEQHKQLTFSVQGTANLDRCTQLITTEIKTFYISV